MITGLRGVVLLNAADAGYLAEALNRFFAVLAESGHRPSAQLVAVQANLTKACAAASESHQNVSANVSSRADQRNSPHAGAYDLVDTAEAARIVDCTQANIRYLARRGRLPARRAGGRWLYPASAVIQLGEQRAARRG